MAIYMWREEETPTFTGLCFTAQEAGSQVQLNKVKNPTAVNLEISSDGDTWSDYTIGTAINLANIGDKLYMRNKSETDTGFSISPADCYNFSMTGKISSNGDVTSLLNKNGTTALSGYCFYDLFNGCTSLTTSPELPATTLLAPELPATTLDGGCYSHMFYGCTNLTTLPSLSATTLNQQCYSYMFYGCKKIKISQTQTGEYQIPYRIPSTGTGTTAKNALLYMFTGTGGTFTGTPTINTTYYTSNTVI